MTPRGAKIESSEMGEEQIWKHLFTKICKIHVLFYFIDSKSLRFISLLYLKVLKHLYFILRKILIEETYKTLLPGKQDNSVSNVWVCTKITSVKVKSNKKLLFYFTFTEKVK